MASSATIDNHAVPPDAGLRAFARRFRHGDEVAHIITLIFGAVILLITSLIVYELWINSHLSRAKFGLSFFWGRQWDPVFDNYGAAPFIYGTLVTSAVALIIAVPLGLAGAIFLAELAPRKLSDSVAFLIDLLAAVPSVIYGKATFDPETRRVAGARAVYLVIKNGQYTLWDGKKPSAT